MSDAHEVARDAVADVLWRQLDGSGVDRPAGWLVQQATEVLAALNTPEVRAAIWLIAHEVTDASLGRPKPHRLRPCCADAVLDALAGAERGERG